ncbi:MAG: hypothetical protein IT195_08615 [Microthrixaceae bacterium]|nr:hypothetical protein [Microthrixaceae bacterium]
MFRRSRPDPLEQIRPDALGARWAIPLRAALVSRQRFGQLVTGVGPGPVRTHLDELSAEVDAAVLAAWERAQQADRVEATLTGLDLTTASDRLKAARRTHGELVGRGATDADLAASSAAVGQEAERFATLNRLVNELDDLSDRLGRLAADLDATIAAAAELTLAQSPSDPSLAPVAARVSALRAAFDELG